MGLVVSRWSRHGRERLYVNDDATREGVGFYDHQTGRLTLKDETRSMEVLEALRPFLTGVTPGSAEGGPQRPRQRRPLQSLQPASEPTQSRLGALLARKTAVKPERVVEKRLGRLRRDGWAVLSPIVRSGGAEIDHLVIGPPGVFTVSAKIQAGAIVRIVEEAVTVDGAQQEYLRDGRQQAAAAERILTSAVGMAVTVTPVLAFVGAASIDAHGSRGEVLVLPGEDIDTILRERLAVHSIQERERILAAARRAELWLA